jgi:putative NADH-flavin reductase
MKIAVLGASGGCGAALVKEALARGHDVVAVVRPSSSVKPAERVVVRRGALDDAAFLATAVEGCDVVLSALGLKAKGFSPFADVEDPTFLRRSSPAIVKAMKDKGIRRLVAISAGGVGDSYAWMPGVFKAIIKTSVLRKVYPELDAMERVFFDSGLEVCVVRPSGLTDGPKTGQARVVRDFKGRASISRADVAAFMLDLVDKPSFPERSPVITVDG